MQTGAYVLSCESPADLSRTEIENRGISCLMYTYSLGGKDYVDDLGKTMPIDEFYRAMADGKMTLTRQPNAETFIDYFTPILESGLDILHVCLSSGLTGVMMSAKLACDTLKEKFPDRKIRLIDSLGASRGFGLFVDKLADLRDEGMSLDELADWADKNRLNVHHWFYSTDLSYYVRGGRITKAEGWFGTVMHICPLLNMDVRGHLTPRMKCRGQKSAMREALKRMEQFAKEGADYSERCFISSANSPAEAKLLAGLVEEKFPKMKGKVAIETIGPIIGSHTGPGTVALFFWGKQRDE